VFFVASYSRRGELVDLADVIWCSGRRSSACGQLRALRYVRFDLDQKMTPLNTGHLAVSGRVALTADPCPNAAGASTPAVGAVAVAIA
jgi:hypothetical protein